MDSLPRQIWNNQFIRKLIEERKIPDDVTIQVLTPAKEDLIRRTVESVRGANRAIVHLYNSTSKVQRDVVFQKSKDEIKNIAVQATTLIKSLIDAQNNPGLRFEYTPESFSGTELDYALEVCAAVVAAWSPSSAEKIIINLPTTVELSTPNVYADRIEWFCRHIPNRKSVIISVHTHNDRGTAVASAELAVMAGAQRVEGALFGNGERSGNMDIITMALNLFSQGVDPELNFSNMDKIGTVYKDCTRMDISPRHPYAGELVYTAFSGTHQDAIHKGMKAQSTKKGAVWNVPYLPIDPKHIGRTYEAIVRINSQSGKGGVAYIMEKNWGLRIPKEMWPELGRTIQNETEKVGRELSSREVKECFDREYVRAEGKIFLKAYAIHYDEGSSRETVVRVVIGDGPQDISFESSGNGPVDAFVRGLRDHCGIVFDIEYYSEHTLTYGSDSRAVAYVGIKAAEEEIRFGAGIDENISIASIKAVVSAINRS